jgi:myo-inositol-1-phosphate synthase
MAKPAGKKVRVAIVGVGNCASSLIQGVEFYKNAKEDEKVPGLMNVNLGGTIFMISSSPLPLMWSIRRWDWT